MPVVKVRAPGLSLRASPPTAPGSPGRRLLVRLSGGSERPASRLLCSGPPLRDTGWLDAGTTTLWRSLRSCGGRGSCSVTAAGEEGQRSSGPGPAGGWLQVSSCYSEWCAAQNLRIASFRNLSFTIFTLALPAGGCG